MQSLRRLVSGIDMTEGVAWKTILLFTIPLLIGNLFQQLFSTVDAIFLGRFVGDDALAAVGATIPFFFLILVISLGVGMGAGIMTAQYFGAKSREDLSHTIGTAITLSVIISLIIMIFIPLMTRPLLLILRTPPEIIDDAVLYMNILLWGIMGVVFFNMLSGILRGMGEAIAPLMYLVIACVLNISLNFIFIVVLGLGVFAVAMGTVIAQGLTSVLCLMKLYSMRHVFDMGKQYLKPKKKYVKQILKLGVPTGASQGIFAIAIMITQPLINDFGPVFIAAYVIVMRIDGFVIMPSFSYGNAMSVFTGQNVGAGKMDRIGMAGKQTVLMSVLTSIVLVSLILLFTRFIAGIFTDTQEVIDITVHSLRILGIGYVAFSVTQVLWGIIRGAGDAMSPMYGALLNSVVIRIPTAFLFVYLMNRPEAIMWSLLVTWVANMFIAYFIFKRGKWRTKGIIKRAVTDSEPATENETVTENTAEAEDVILTQSAAVTENELD